MILWLLLFRFFWIYKFKLIVYISLDYYRIHIMMMKPSSNKQKEQPQGKKTDA